MTAYRRSEINSFFIGITGGSGSGKTWLAKDLAQALGPEQAAVIETDAYYRDLSPLSPGRRAAINFDHPDALEAELLSAHLAALARGEAIEKPVYDFSTHARTGQTQKVHPRPCILVEGVMVLAIPAVAACLDFSIFLDIPADIRFIRRLRRDRAERGRSVSRIIDQYLAQVRPMHETFVAPCRKAANLILTDLPDVPELIRTISTARGRRPHPP